MKGKSYFIYVGNAYPHKNLEKLIDAVVLLNSSVNHTVNLKIVSARNIFLERIINYIKKSNASKCVETLAHTSDEELKRIYANSIGFVFPSLSEGFGLPGIEAMRAGTLVLASDIKVFHEIYQENAIYFDPNDILSIKGGMLKALKLNMPERLKIINKSNEFVKKYSWRKMAMETLEVYNLAAK